MRTVTEALAALVLVAIAAPHARGLWTRLSCRVRQRLDDRYEERRRRDNVIRLDTRMRRRG